MKPPSRPSNVRPMVPDVPPLTRALERTTPLVSLLYRLKASQQCLEAIQPVLPAGLAPYVKAGPIDDEGWTVLVANAAISAKLRQLQPRLMDMLAAKGCKVNAIRLRVQTPQP